MGLALEERRGAWRLDNDLRATLTRMGRTQRHHPHDAARDDRQRAGASPTDYAIYDAGSDRTAAITGRVVARGLSDEHGDRHYLIVDATDGHSHFVDIGVDAPPTVSQSIVRIAPVRAGAAGGRSHGRGGRRRQ